MELSSIAILLVVGAFLFIAVRLDKKEGRPRTSFYGKTRQYPFSGVYATISGVDAGGVLRVRIGKVEEQVDLIGIKVGTGGVAVLEGQTGKTVWLEFDPEHGHPDNESPSYKGKLSAFVWLPETLYGYGHARRHLNEWMLLEGYASYDPKPSHKYRSKFNKLKQPNQPSE
jgi:hypothetical protein